MDEYLGHLREFRRILQNLGGERSHPVHRDTISALSQKLDRDESQLNAERLERSLRATVESAETIQALDHYEEDLRAVLRDVTSKKRRELERARFRKLLDQSGESILVVEPYTGRFVDVNETATRFLGYSRDELLELSLGSVEVGLPLGTASGWHDWVESIRREPEVKVMDGMHRLKDGSFVPVEASIGFATVDNEELLLVITRDITKRKRVEGRMRRQWGFFSKVVHRSIDGVFALDRELNVTFWNPAMERVLGLRRSDVIGKNVLLAVPAFKELEEEAFFRDALEGNVATSRDRVYAHPETHRRVYFDAYYSPLREESGDLSGMVGILRDVTDYRESHARQARKTREMQTRIDQERVSQIRMQERLQGEIDTLKEENERLAVDRETSRAARESGPPLGGLEGIELLASGMVKALEPLMGNILSQTGVALSELAPDSPLRGGFEEIEEAALNTTSLATTLSSYSGNGVVDGPELRLDTLVSDLEHTLRSAAKRDLEVRTPSSSEPLPGVTGDARQLRELLAALVVNGAEAMNGEGGAVTITMGTAELDEEALGEMFLGRGRAPGTYVYLEVRDSGSGMDETTKTRSVVPFFSTKKGHRGLGLATALGVLRAHGGALSIQTKPGEGSTVRALFPVR